MTADVAAASELRTFDTDAIRVFRKSRPHAVTQCAETLLEQIHRQGRPRKDRLEDGQQDQNEDRQAKDLVRKNSVDALRDPMFTFVVVVDRFLDRIRDEVVA